MASSNVAEIISSTDISLFTDKCMTSLQLCLSVLEVLDIWSRKLNTKDCLSRNRIVELEQNQ